MSHVLANKSTIDRAGYRSDPWRSAVQLLQRLSPALAAWAVEPLFLTPTRHARPASEESAFRSAVRSSVRHRGRRVPLYSWGHGPVVLFAHGWEGRATQVAPLLEPLLAAGFRVVAYDMLGHGEAPRALVSVVDFAAVARSVVSALGEEVHAAIGHSVGGTALLIAAAQLPFAERIAVIGSPLHPRGFLAQFTSAFSLSSETHRALLARLSARYGLPFGELDAAGSVAQGRSSALVVHDRADREVPFVHAERLARAWPAATLVATEGLGHRRILRDREVVRVVTRFIGDAPRTGGFSRSIELELFEREGRMLAAYPSA